MVKINQSRCQFVGGRSLGTIDAQGLTHDFWFAASFGLGQLKGYSTRPLAAVVSHKRLWFELKGTRPVDRYLVVVKRRAVNFIGPDSRPVTVGP